MYDGYPYPEALLRVGKFDAEIFRKEEKVTESALAAMTEYDYVYEYEYEVWVWLSLSMNDLDNLVHVVC